MRGLLSMVFAAPEKIPVSVIVVTRNEEARIAACLASLADFDEIIVVDSASTDKTQDLAHLHGAKVVNFVWDGRYPKKRQWCLDTLDLAHDWVFFVDADEVLTSEICAEIRGLDFSAAGYFVPGRYYFEGKLLRCGLRNNKLALVNRRKIGFPVIDDLDMPGMGEIEGHYQPVLKKEFRHEYIGQLKCPLVHYAFEGREGWRVRHERYAAWERAMNRRGAWPEDPVFIRALLKRIFRAMPLRPLIAFLHCYILKLGFLDGSHGFRFAKSRYDYYAMI